MTNQEIRAAIQRRHDAGLTGFNVPYEEWERRYSGAPEYWIDCGELNPGVWATKHMMLYFGPGNAPEEAPNLGLNINNSGISYAEANK